MSELRRDALTGNWVVITPERSRRKDVFIRGDREGEKCPFCGWGHDLYEIYKIESGEGKELITVPNRYPVLGIEGTLERSPKGIYDEMTGIGANEIIIDSPRHALKASEYTEKELTNLFTAIRNRINDLKNDLRFRYITAFKNIGKDSGAIIDHPHSQIIALPVIPPAILNELSRAVNYYKEKERCIICDIKEHEIKEKVRIVYENHDFIAICPYASGKPFSVSVYPKMHQHSFTEINDLQIKQLADIVREVYIKLALILGEPSIMTAIKTAPQKEGRSDVRKECEFMEESFHWHCEIEPVIMRQGGFELAAGVSDNPVSPEESALYLREASDL